MRAPVLTCFLAFAVLTAMALPACEGGKAPSAGGGGTPPSATGTTPAEPDAGPTFPSVTLPATPQRAGDPAKGYRALVNEAYVPCGIPYSAYSQVFPKATPDRTIPGREGRNAELPYGYTAFTTRAGVELVGSNCLTCHAGRIDGQLLVGLGAADGDFTQDPDAQKRTFAAVGLLLRDPKEQAEWQKWKERVDTIAPYAYLDTRGPNPADAFTASLFAHHDPKTLAWLSSPRMAVPPPADLPVDVPPWWHMAKKNAMFYVGAGRGDHARHMMTASLLCISSVEEARTIDAYFGDVRAYIASLRAPRYPRAIDAARAKAGAEVFARTCARCHGTYGPSTTYPNRLVSLAEVGTDGLLASGTAQFAGPFVDWHKESFFGETASLEPQVGYVAPPLDGVWATGPYLHNGSVPTVAALLDSKRRPKYWTRTFDSKALDEEGLGFQFTELDHGKDGEPAGSSSRAALYDTTRPGYGNGGHTFGDALTDVERAAVLEYLKTL